MMRLSFQSAGTAECARTFLRAFLVGLVAVLAGWFAIVLAFDPYLAFGTRVLPRSVILPTSRMLGDEQLIKDHLFQRQKPQTVVIGSSRAAYGIDPSRAPLADEKSYNLAMLGASLANLEGLAAEVRASGHVKRLIINIDYYMFFQRGVQANGVDAPDFRLSRMEDGKHWLPIPLRHVQTFIASTKVMQAMQTMLLNARRKDRLGDADANGMMHGTYRFRVADRSRTFEVTLRALLLGGWYSVPDEALIRARLMRLAGLVRVTCKAGIRIDAVLSPEHAMLHEAAVLTGQQVRREQLRRDVARLMSLMAEELPGCLRYRDASGLSDSAVEPLQLPDGRTPQFIEVSHYAPALGERILLGFLQPDHARALGIDPARDDLEEDIRQTRMRLERWRSDNPQDAALVKRLQIESKAPQP